MKMPLSRVPRSWRIILILSLAANLCVAGIVIGAMFDRHGPGRHEGMRGPAGIVVGALPDDDRQAVIETLRRMPREEQGRLRVRGRAGFEALQDAIRAEPFDAARVEALLTEQRNRGTARLERVERAVLDRLDTMSPERREEFARRLAEGAHRR